MKVIIAGSRTINDYTLVNKVIKNSGFKIDEVISGCANGVDKCGEYWAKAHDIPIKYFPADWDNIEHSKAIVKINKYGKKYNAIAGMLRNEEMAMYANALIAIIKDNSSGTTNMIKLAEKYKLKIYIWEV